MAQKITAQMKKEITQQWHEIFPSMGIYRTMDFANILGPLVIGLTMRAYRIVDRYTPKLYIHILCREWSTISLCVGIEDGTISTRSPDDKYLKVADNLKAKAVVPIDGDVDLKLILKKLREYYNYRESYYINTLGGKYETYESINIFEIMIYLSAWSGVESALRDTQEFVEGKIKTFSPDYFVDKPTIEFVENADGIGISQWFDEMKELIKDTEKLRSTVPKQIEALKLNKLPVRNIIF